MENLSYLKDSSFLKALDNEVNKFYWVRIEVLNMDELPINSIEGRVQNGSSITIDGNSSVRRTCNINFIAEDTKNDLNDVENLLSINKKIKIMVGIENHIDNHYDSIIWFPQGIFVIVQPSISNTAGGCFISLSCKDKMCLLNGECGGNLPTSVTFHEYEQIIGQVDCTQDPETITDKSFIPNNYTVYSYISNDGETRLYKTWTKEYGWKQEKDNSAVGELVAVPQLVYDIIRTVVCNYGGESLDNIFINDIPLEIKQIVRYVGSDTLYYNLGTSQYTTDQSYVTQDGVWRPYNYNEDVGYIYTDFVYPGKLITNIGDNICTVLDRIKNTLGNFEYFYDVDGRFVFQEIKNYLNNSYDPTDVFRLDNYRKVDINEIQKNNLAIIDGTNYEVDFNSSNKSVYTFEEGNGLITSFGNTPSYTNLKNDFHIWGKNNDGYAVHYHLALKNKPQIMGKYRVVFMKDGNGELNGRLRLASNYEEAIIYTPSDWRAELYLRGLEKQQKQQRPDIYEQELLDLFDSIYDFSYYDELAGKYGRFKADMVHHPNDLLYFFDFLENVYDCSIDLINPKVYSYQQDKINRLYNDDIPNVIILDTDMDSKSRNEMIERCVREGQPYTNVTHGLYTKLAIGTVGYSAQEVARDLLYQYTNYNESITIQSIPIYYLDVNSRISVYDQKSGIHGDYIIKNISIPLNAGSTMNITATRALEKV